MDYCLKSNCFFIFNKINFLNTNIDKTIEDYVDKVQETISYIKDKTNFTPEYGVILGSGLEDLQKTLR